MTYKKLNDSWKPDPNVPEPVIYIKDNTLILDFFLNYFIYPQIKKGQKGRLEFYNCFLYRMGSPNDHGFYLKQFRYGPDDIPWGEFYELFESNWKSNFPDDKVILDKGLEKDEHLKHFIFFFRDEGFECLAKNYKFKYLEDNEKIQGVKVYPK